MGSVHARGDTFLTFGLKALTETNTSRLATAIYLLIQQNKSQNEKNCKNLNTLTIFSSYSACLAFSFLLVSTAELRPLSRPIQDST
jgi:hypothetical protein